MKTCSVEGCEKAAKSRGFCFTHYTRWYRHGDTSVNKRPGCGIYERPAKPQCFVKDCKATAYGKGLCHKHWKRLRKHGSPYVAHYIIGDEPWAFFSKVEFTATCWLWKASVSQKGYGQFLYGERKSNAAHRWAYEFCVGQIPEGLQIDHLCRVRRCVNPDHLEPVTPRVNALRGYGPSGLNARKTHCKRGHPLSGDNLYVYPSGRRWCRSCKRDASRQWMAAKRRQPAGTS